MSIWSIRVESDGQITLEAGTLPLKISSVPSLKIANRFILLTKDYGLEDAKELFDENGILTLIGLLRIEGFIELLYKI